MFCRYGVKRVKQQVDAIGQKNDRRMEQIVMEKLCKLRRETELEITFGFFY